MSALAEAAMPVELNLPISDAEFALFRRLFADTIGLSLSQHKKLLVSGRLGKRLRELGLVTFRAYYDLIQQTGHDGAELQRAIDLITTNETYFFREAKHFELLERMILAQRDAARPLKVWSAACSTGEEAYSIAMVLHQALGDQGWQLLATDISARVLHKARRGLYPTERIAGIPPALLKRYCLRGTGKYDGMLLIDRCLRQRVEFRPANLIAVPAEMQGFDVIFLRNVIIYFDAETKARVVNDMVRRLRPGGWLLLGHSESLAGMPLVAQQIRPSVYRRPLG